MENDEAKFGSPIKEKAYFNLVSRPSYTGKERSVRLIRSFKVTIQ